MSTNNKRDTRIDAAYEEADYFYVYNYFTSRGWKVEQTEVGGKIDYTINRDDMKYLVEAKFRSIDFDNEGTKPWYFNYKRLIEMRRMKGDKTLMLYYAFPKNNKVVFYDLDKLHLDDEQCHQIIENVNNPSKKNENLDNLLLRDSDITAVRDSNMDYYRMILHQAMIHQGIEDNKEILDELKKWQPKTK